MSVCLSVTMPVYVYKYTVTRWLQVYLLNCNVVREINKYSHSSCLSQKRTSGFPRSFISSYCRLQTLPFDLLWFFQLVPFQNSPTETHSPSSFRTKKDEIFLCVFWDEGNTSAAVASLTSPLGNGFRQQRYDVTTRWKSIFLLKET